MKMKKSKLTNVQGNGNWKEFFKFDVEFENGECGTIYRKSNDAKVNIGEEYSYTLSDKGTVKIVNTNFTNSSNNSFKDHTDRQESIIRQSTLKCAVEYLKGAEASLEEVFEAAEQMILWVNKSEVNKTVKEDLDSKDSNNDLPF